jgi:hypothetical protein
LVIIFGMKNDMKENKGLQIFISAVVIIVIAMIGVSLFMIGSPQKERARRFDGQRVSDLWSIERQVQYQWDLEQAVPESLAEIKEQLYRGDGVNDPETNKTYAYTKISDDSYEICVQFNLEADEDMNNRSYANPKGQYFTRSSEYDRHQLGDNCFTLIFDPIAYEKIQNGEDMRQLIDPIVAY